MFATKRYVDEYIAEVVENLEDEMDIETEAIVDRFIKIETDYKRKLNALLFSSALHNETLRVINHKNRKLEETVAELYAIVDDLQEQIDGKAKPKAAPKRSTADTDQADEKPVKAVKKPVSKAMLGHPSTVSKKA